MRIIIVSIILLTLLYVSLRYKLGAMKKKYPKVAKFPNERNTKTNYKKKTCIYTVPAQKQHAIRNRDWKRDHVGVNNLKK